MTAVAARRRPRCLLLTQSAPAVGGHGASMRAGFTVEGLSQDFDLTLLLVTALERVERSDVPDELARLCTDVRFVKVPPATRRQDRPWQHPTEWHWAQDDLSRALADHTWGHFEHVHLFRLRLLPVWRRLQDLGASASRVVLDLDDIESRATWRELRQPGRRVGVRTTLSQALEVLRLRAAERQAASSVDAILTCSEDDRLLLQQRWPGAAVRVLPNAARLPARALPPPQRSARGDSNPSLNLLFVGSLFYEPNVQAARWLLQALMPTLARRGLPCRLVIAGRRAPPDLVALGASVRGAEVLSDVPDLDPLYEQATVVVCPVQSGGGTRIKIIEALGHGRALVTTRIGAEGLGLEPGRHALFAESADEFAAALAQLQSAPAMADALAAAGRAHVEVHFSPQAFHRQVLAAHRG